MLEDLSERLSTDPNNNNNDTTNRRPSGDKYSLRPRRRPEEHSDGVPERPTPHREEQPRPTEKTSTRRQKQKPAPLSKYRRKTANARERSRMREINQAFEALRRAVPQMSLDRSASEKLTKITTLRLAMKYISTLSAALTSGGGSERDFFGDDLDCCFLLESSDGESLPALNSDLSESSLDFGVDFGEDSLTDFGRLSPMESQLTQFDPFLGDFS